MHPNRDKSLPLLPPRSTKQTLEIEKLRARIGFLEDVVEILYKKNLQYSTALKEHKIFEQKLEKKMDRMVRSTTEVVAERRQSLAKLEKLEAQASNEWHEYFDLKKLEAGDKIEEYLEELKEQMIENDTEEIWIGFTTQAAKHQK
jgi:arginine deiminase